MNKLAAIVHFAVPPVCPVCLAKFRNPPDDPDAICDECRQTLKKLNDIRCMSCGGSLDTALDECAECLQRGKRPWAHAVSAFPFKGKNREIIHRFKYRKQTCLARFLARRMSENWQEYGTACPDLITPVPLHWLRRILRGYNQAGLLASHLGRLLDVPVRETTRRTAWTPQQAKLDLSNRQSNVKQAFKPIKGISLKNKSILLVDDVITTGATLAAVSNALLAKNARSVSVITAARG